MEIRDEQWAIIEPIIRRSEKEKRTGRPIQDLSRVFNGSIWILRKGARWKDLPRESPPYQTCHRWFAKWAETGILNEIL